MKPAKWSHWTEDERRTLATYIKKGQDKKTKISVICAVASKKLGRTKASCEFQYQQYLKNNMEFYLTPVESPVEAPVEELKDKLAVDWDFANAEPTSQWTAAKVERIVEDTKPERKLPTIEVHSTMNSEVCEIIEHVGDTIIARASRGIIIVIKQ